MSSNDHWQKIHQIEYKDADWINKPSIFAQQAIEYFPKTGKLLELGAGQGQDSRYFAEHGYEVLSTDLEDSALELSRSKTPKQLVPKLTVQKLDLKTPLAFANNSFDIVYAHLSLHYFSDQDTKRIFADIYRVLKSGGIFAFFTNSTSDPEYGSGETIEPDYFMVDGVAKRYFTVQTASAYAETFDVKLADNNGETYKDLAKGVHNLIRYIGIKR